MEIIVDDFLIHGKDQTDTDQKLRAMFDKSRELGLKLQSLVSSSIGSLMFDLKLPSFSVRLMVATMAHNLFKEGQFPITGEQIVDRWLDSTKQSQIGRELNIPRSTVQSIVYR